MINKSLVAKNDYYAASVDLWEAASKMFVAETVSAMAQGYEFGGGEVYAIDATEFNELLKLPELIHAWQKMREEGLYKSLKLA